MTALKKAVRTRRGVEPAGRPARREVERGRRARTNSCSAPGECHRHDLGPPARARYLDRRRGTESRDACAAPRRRRTRRVRVVLELLPMKSRGPARPDDLAAWTVICGSLVARHVGCAGRARARGRAVVATSSISRRSRRRRVVDVHRRRRAVLVPLSSTSVRMSAMPQARPSLLGPRSTRKVQPVQSSRASFLWLFSSVAMVLCAALAP